MSSLVIAMHDAPAATVSTIILPFISFAACAIVLVLVASRGQKTSRTATVLCALFVGILTAFSSLLLRDVSMLIVSMVPLGFASYAEHLRMLMPTALE